MGFLLAHAIDRRADAEPTADAGGQELAVTTQQMPYEAVRDFFCAQRNHFDTLDRAAEALATKVALIPIFQPVDSLRLS